MYEFFRFNKFFLFVFLIFIDQLSKYIIRHTGGFYVCNGGVGFGIKIPEYIFYFIWIIIIVHILQLMSREKKVASVFYILCLTSYVLILAGAISNVIDRISYGCVIDFIDLKIWPVFNLADAFITIGAAGMVYVVYKNAPIIE